jgi:hypothetical protein
MTPDHKGNGLTHSNGITRTDTAQAANMFQEMFEKLYLQPQNRVHSDLRQTFANPTPLWEIHNYSNTSLKLTRINTVWQRPSWAGRAPEVEEQQQLAFTTSLVECCK